MNDNLIVISVEQIPYKKIGGILRSMRINPNLVAKSIATDGLRFVPIRWQNYLIFSHKIKKIVLLKEDDLFLFVGYSVDDETIVYNNDFSKKILKIDSCIIEKRFDFSNTKSTNFKIDKNKQIDILLDKIVQSGINSLSEYEMNQLNYLSKQNLK